MARKIKEKDTDIFEDDLLSMIDDEVDQQSPVQSSYTEEQDDDLEQAYDDLNMTGYITDSGDTTKVARKQKPQVAVRTKPNIAPNPFEKTEPVEKTTTYTDVVDQPASLPRMDIRPYTTVPVKKSRRRFKLWLVTGICAICLLVSATMIGLFGLGAGAGTRALGANNAETGELASDQGIINLTDSELTEDQVADWLANGKNLPKNITKHDLSSDVNAANQNVNTSSSVWDKVCDFFSRLFGR